MRIKFKPVSALALTCAVALAVAACGGGGGSSTGSGSTSSSSSAEISGTVTIWDFEYGSIPKYTEGMKALDASFEKSHPGVKIDRVAVAPEGYEAQYRAAFASHEGPDIMTFQPGASGILSFTPGLEVLNDRISPELQEKVTQWDTVTPEYTEEGEHYGVPLGLQGWIFYYNKKLFAKAGLPQNFRPESWAEVREAGEQLQSSGIQPFAGGDKEGYENLWWFTAGFRSENAPEKITQLAEGKLPYTDPAIAKAFKPDIEMEEAGLYPSNRFSSAMYTEGYPAFAEGKSGMTLGFFASGGAWGEFVPALGEKNVGMFFAPGESPIGTTSSVSYGIPKFAKNKEAAWAFLEYQMSKKGIELLDEKADNMPNRTDVSLPSDAPIQEREILKAVETQGPVLEPLITVPAAVAFGTMAPEISEVLQGRTSLEDAQSAMQETAERSSTE